MSNFAANLAAKSWDAILAYTKARLSVVEHEDAKVMADLVNLMVRVLFSG